MRRISSKEVARRRVIQRFECTKRKAVIQAHGKTFNVLFDDLLDLVQAVEMIMMKLTGKVLNGKFRPEIKNRGALQLTSITGGACGDDAPLPKATVCDITERMVPTHYLKIEIQGNVWEQWFGRLDELVKCLYIVVREAQGDPYIPGITSRAPKRTFVIGEAGHA